MKKYILTLLVILVTAGTGFSQEKRTLTLDEVINLAKTNSRSAKQAETFRTFGYWGFKVYQSGLKPQLRLSGTLPNYRNRSIPVTQPDGTVEFRSVNQNNVNIGLGLEQVLPWTNTTVTLSTSLLRFDDFEQDFSNYQGDPFGIRIQQELFSVNPYKWDKVIEPLRYEQSKRKYVQDLENTSKTAASLFFRLLVVQKDLEIALQNEASNDTINRIEKGRYNIGTTTEDKLLQTEADLLQAQGNAQQARLDVQSQSLALRTFIGLTDNVDLELVTPEDAPDFQVDFESAYQYAKDNRSQFLDFKIDRLNAQRGVANAKARRFNASISASFGYNSAQTSSIGDIYDPIYTAAGGTFSLNFNMPLLDGGRNKARMNQARENEKLTEFTIEQNQITFEQEISTAVRNFGQMKSQIEIAQKRQVIALKGFDISNSRYLAGKVDILDLSSARTSKDSSIRQYISALSQYWDAYYGLRTLTLYDFQNRVLLYNPLLEYDPKTDTGIIKESK
jgi:Outer membrane efflux protein